MCIAIMKPKGFTVSEKALKTCWQGNDDGAGFMFSDGGKLHLYKGYMNWDTFLDSYRWATTAYTRSPFVIHFRIGTGGTVSPENCHPFLINDTLGFVHNGILPDIDTELMEGSCDSAIFCEDVLRQLPEGWLSNKYLRLTIEGYCKETASKFVFLDNLGNVTIMNERSGHWHNGVWYSNWSYKYLINSYVLSSANADTPTWTGSSGATSSRQKIVGTTHGILKDTNGDPLHGYCRLTTCAICQETDATYDQESEGYICEDCKMKLLEMDAEVAREGS